METEFNSHLFSSDQSLREFGSERNALSQIHATLLCGEERDQGSGVFSVPLCLRGESLIALQLFVSYCCFQCRQQSKFFILHSAFRIPHSVPAAGHWTR